MHWRHGGHKKACKAYVLADTVHAQHQRLCRAAVETDRCLICLEPPREPTRLPCGHSFCTGCVSELRAKGVSQTCPLCRAALPPGPEKLYDLAGRVFMKIARAVDPNRTGTWPALSASQQEEMNGAIVMLQEAMDQGHILAARSIGDIYFWGKGVAQDYERAMAAYKVAAEAGDAFSQYQVMMYCKGLGVAVDYQQARAWLEKAAAQDFPDAVRELGVMYFEGWGVTPSWRRARELCKRAIELGDSQAVKNMQSLTVCIQAAAPLMDQRVEIHGTSRTDMNGKCGVATDFHPMGGGHDRSQDRYVVQLDSGEAFKVKPANVRAEGTGAGGSKAKSKGKKGKKGRGGRW